MESSNQVAQIALETGEVILHVLLDDVPDVVTRRLVPVGGRKVELLMPDLSVRQAHVAFLLPILLCRLRAACPVGFAWIRRLGFFLWYPQVGHLLFVWIQ